MIKGKLLSLAVAGALTLLASPVLSATVSQQDALEVGSVAAIADPLLAVEANRSAIVERLVLAHRATLFANGIAESSFRNALYALRADHLLAASLVDDFAALTAIVSQVPIDGASSRRFVAMVPTAASTLGALPAAEAYVLRDGDTLRIVKRSELQLTNPDARLVGYFVSGASTVITSSAFSNAITKDGSGSGANSWIGYVAGSNAASGSGSAVAAGRFNTASGQNAFVAAGQSNVASGISSLVIGGFDNRATVIDAMVVAGAGNRATGARSVVVGGGYNLASGQWSFIGGGGRQTGSGAAGAAAQDHIASGDYSAVVGGRGNRATGGGSFVGGGWENTASSTVTTVAGGQYNTASGLASTVAGGYRNRASGDDSFVAGREGHANLPSCAILAFWSTTPTFDCLGGSNVVRVGADHGFSVDYFGRRADGGGIRGVYIGDFIAGQTIYTWTGAHLTDGGVWTNASDRNSKDGFAPVDARDVLRRVADLPIQRWYYKTEGSGVMHIGPVAQDFHAAIGLGNSDKAIGTDDADGRAMAAIQGLYQEVQERDARISLQQQRIAILEQRLDDVAASQAQLRDLQKIVLTLQHEMALLRETRNVAQAAQ